RLAVLRADVAFDADRLAVDRAGVGDPALRRLGICETRQVDIEVAEHAVGKTSIPALTADIGGNRLTGNVEFSSSLEPTGALTLDFPNIGLL
ncbi:hypothetical protein ACC754_38645, partial [Rhizobium johnstonii]